MGKRTTPRRDHARRERFIEEYPIDRNGTQAAIRAGYNARSARTTAARLLADDGIAAEIAKRSQRISNACEISTQRIMQEYARLAFLDIKNIVDDDGNLLPIKDMPEDSRRAIAGLDIEERREGQGDDVATIRVRKVKLADKIRALDSLANIHKMFPSAHNVVVTGPNGGPIKIDSDESKIELARRIAFLLRSTAESAKSQGKPK